jgi:hypothetical protein
MILLERIPYLAFAESIPENVTGFDNKIINEYWLRELCTYVS